MTRALRPGLPVVRRDDGHLQVGIDPPHRAVLPDHPDVRRVLASLVRREAPAPGGATPRVLAALGAAGLLCERPPRAASAGRGRSAAAAEAAWARHGDDAARRLAARAATTVSLDAPTGPVEELERLATEAGLRVSPGLGDVHVVLAHGPVARDRVDACLRAGTPHLVVAGGAGGYVVGPFVLPGATACLRCDDAHRAEADPRRAVVVEQAARSQTEAPVDPVLLTLATAWAVRDVLAWVEGERPATWAASYDLGAGALPVRREWSRHPHCGCTWADWLAG